MVNVDRRDEALLKIVENNRENRAAKQPSVKRLIWEESEKKVWELWDFLMVIFPRIFFFGIFLNIRENY